MSNLVSFKKLVMNNIASFNSYQQITASQSDQELSLQTGPTFIQRAGNPPQRLINELNSTDVNAKALISSTNSVPTDRLYPHVFDSSTDTGNMLIYLREALTYTEHAIDSYSLPDLATTTTHLTSVANSMRLAYSHASFNKPLRGLISYIRRSSLMTPIDVLSLASLNALTSALNSIISDPLLSLDEATEHTERLSENSWRGENVIVEALISEMLDEPNLVLEKEHT